VIHVGKKFQQTTRHSKRSQGRANVCDGASRTRADNADPVRDEFALKNVKHPRLPPPRAINWCTRRSISG